MLDYSLVFSVQWIVYTFRSELKCNDISRNQSRNLFPLKDILDRYEA